MLIFLSRFAPFLAASFAGETVSRIAALTLLIGLCGFAAVNAPRALANDSVSHEEGQTREGLKELYNNCMGGTTTQSDPERHVYCECVANKSAHLSTAAYASIAADQLASPGAPPRIVREISEECMQEIINSQ